MPYSSDILWSINIMCAILVVGVALFLYYIFKYDDWYPNPIPIIDSEPSDGVSGETATLSRDVARQHGDSERVDSTDETVGIRADIEGS